MKHCRKVKGEQVRDHSPNESETKNQTVMYQDNCFVVNVKINFC